MSNKNSETFKLIKAISGKRTKYTVPFSQKSKELVRNVMQQLHDQGINYDASKYPSLNFKIVGNKLVIWPKKVNTEDDISISIIYNPTSTSNLCIEVPHEGKDGTTYATSDIFDKLDFKWMIINYQHPSTVKAVGTQHSITDMCHYPGSHMTTAQTMALDLDSTTLFIQVHGMTGAANFQMLVVNVFNRQFVKNGVCYNFAKAVQNNFNEDRQRQFAFASEFDFPNIFRLPERAHNSNTQGRAINKNKDSGQFMHLELGTKFRDSKNENMRSSLISALNELNKKVA